MDNRVFFMNNEQALSEIVSVILILSLVVIIGGILLVTVLGMAVVPQKSALIAIDITDPEIGNKGFIRICNQGGDTGCLNQTGHEDNPIGIYLDTASGSHRALPVPGLDLFSPGSTLYIYNSTGTYIITNDITSLITAEGVECPVTVRVVDEKTKVLIAEWKRTSGGVLSVLPRTLFSDTFDTGISGWITNEVTTKSFDSPKYGICVKMKKGGWIQKTVSTEGYDTINVSFALGTSYFEGSEAVQVQWSSNGASWTVFKTIEHGDTDEDGQLHDFTYSLPDGASNNPNFTLKFMIYGADLTDYGYVDNVVVSGIPM